MHDYAMLEVSSGEFHTYLSTIFATLRCAMCVLTSPDFLPWCISGPGENPLVH